MKITKVGKPEHRLVSNAVIAALKAVADEFGIDFSAAGGEVGTTRGMMKLRFDIRDIGTGVSGAETTFKAYAKMIGLVGDSFGKTFQSKGTFYKVVGLNINAPRFPVEAVRVHDGAGFKFPVETINKHFPLRLALAA